MQNLIILSLALCLSFSGHAQKVKEKDIVGTWKLVIDIEEEMEKEAEESDTMLTEVFIKAISGFVGGVLDDIDIYFEFEKDHDCKITVEAYGETEKERAEWRIDENGLLQIEGLDDNDKFNVSVDDDGWMFSDGVLIQADKEDERTVYMKRMTD